MEEQRAKDPSKMPDMAITGLKTGLMGPVAALGDSFDWGIIGTLMKIAAATLAAAEIHWHQSYYYCSLDIVLVN